MLPGRAWMMKMACTRHFTGTANATKKDNTTLNFCLISPADIQPFAAKNFSYGHTILYLNVTSDTHSCMSVQLQKVKSQQKDFHHTSKLRVLISCYC